METDECPRCGGDIRRKSGSLFHCVACRRLYVTFEDSRDRFPSGEQAPPSHHPASPVEGGATDG